MDLSQAANLILTHNMGVRSGEKVLLIVDEKTEEIGQALWKEAVDLKAEALLVKMKERCSHADEPPAPIFAAMMASDVIIAPTAKSLSHTAARKKATANGARMATMPGITTEVVCRSISPDFAGIKQRSEVMAKLLSEGTEARITTAKGTNLSLSIKGRMGEPDIGAYHEPGSFGNLPSGEAYAAPVEGTANGTIVCDTSIGGIGAADKDMTVKVENGFMVDIQGGKLAADFKQALEQHGKWAYNIAELGVGTNDQTKISGNTIEDEKVLGTVHIGVGSNKAFGGNVELPFHTDMVIQKPTFYIDDRLIIKDGEWVI